MATALTRDKLIILNIIYVCIYIASLYTFTIWLANIGTDTHVNINTFKQNIPQLQLSFNVTVRLI